MLRIVVEGTDFPDPAGVVPPALEAAATETVALLERAVKILTPIGVTEAARGSIAGEVHHGTRFGHGEVVGTVGSPLAHVHVLEHGRRPGQKMPPPDALELWVRRRLGVQDVDEARGIAFVVARKIGREGTEAVGMFRRALEQNEGRIRDIWERAGFRIVIRTAGRN